MKANLYGAIFLLSFFVTDTAVFAQETNEEILLDFFNPQIITDNTEGLKIRNDTEKMNEAIKKAQNESPEKGLSTLNHALTTYKKALSTKEAENLKAQFINSINAERERERQMAQLRKIRVESHGNGPFVIRKRLNQENDWELLLVPYSERETVIRLWNLYRECHKNRMQRDKNKRLSDDYHRKGDVFLKVSAEYMKMANIYYKEAMNFKDEANKLFRQLREKNPRSLNMSTHLCSLYDLTVPVMIVACESSISGYEPVTYFWYREYQPGKSGNYWEISDIY